MSFIRPANIKDTDLLTDIGRSSFVESHGRSARPEDIEAYLNLHMSKDAFRKELNDPKNIYHILFHQGEAAGYSKIILNAPHPNLDTTRATKLERIYLLEKFHGLKLGYLLFEFNLELSRKSNQEGMWLFVWIENLKAIGFYKKLGFEIVGSHDFRISNNHSNPNHQLMLKY